MSSSDKCRAGLHRWTDKNTILIKTKGGGVSRMCRACKQARERAYRKQRADLVKVMARVTKDRARARGLAPDDPRHGTLNAYQMWGCRCAECRAANATATRINVLKRKAKKLGIELPKERNTVKTVSSLDGVAEAWHGMDRILLRSIWDDPTAEEALSRS